MSSGLTVVLKGENSFILKTRNHGNITVGTTLSADGGNSQTTYPSHLLQVEYGIGKLGGADGGLKNTTPGYGAGGGAKNLYIGGQYIGGGAGYGSNGEHHSTDISYGGTYGHSSLSHLHGGSGGGAGYHAGGGAGAGAISLEADGNGTLTINNGGIISANGGSVSATSVNGGGGGSGGSIRLSGKSITNNGTIRAKGATPPAGGTGGGGRVAFNYSTNLIEGTVDVGTGAYRGTVAYNTPPVVSSGNTATATYSNINYRRQSATRYNDLVFWYPFDETEGTTALDYSENGRDATLKNMTIANRVGGKIGRGLSFTTPSTKTSSDETGQHLDLGTWSFGGAHSIATWIKADEWRYDAPILFLAGNDQVALRYNSASGTTLTHAIDGSAAGSGEWHTSPSGLLEWSQWVHLAVTVEDTGVNQSTIRFYKDGNLFATSPADKTAPDTVTRTVQYVARSDSGTNYKYFSGTLDELRLYNVALSADDVSAIYTETNGTTWYTISAVNSPTSFSASGLPTGLSVNPDTGEISGHTTAIGDHNVTVTASNLSGSDSKVVTLTVYATKPLLESGLYQPTGMNLWLDASSLSTAGTTWDDKSGNNNHATKHNTPTVVTNAQNGLSLMRYETDGGDTGGSPDYHEWQDISDIRTVFCVIKRDADATDNLSQAIADDNNYHFFAGSGGNISDGTYAHANVRNGLTKLNGSSVTGTSVAFPTSLSVLTHRTTGNVEASRIGKDRHHTGRYSFDGDYGELLIFNSDLSDTDIAKIEGYLAHKWGLTGSLANNHPYKANSISQPVVTVDSVGSTSGTASVTILETGGANVTIDYYYGSSDKGETTSGWDFNGTLGTQSAGTSTVALNGLSASNQYVFRIKATNSAGSVWTNATAFTTNSQTQPPAISAGLASSVQGTATTANGNLLAKDGATSVDIFYGKADLSDVTTGWTSSNLTGDSDSGISSAHTYTIAVNPRGTTEVVNGVTFSGTGNSEYSGSLWEITAGLNNAYVTSQNSSVAGKIGDILDDSFFFDGDPQKLKVKGLTHGKKYVFSLFSQAFGSENRTCVLSCSDLSGSLTINQNHYNSSSQDGLLVECTYIADGTEAEFTIDPAVSNTSWHLYAFANREASIFDSSTASLGTKDVGTFTHNLTGLTTGERYHYLFKATTSSGGNSYVGYSNTSEFVTLGTPEVLTPGATDVTKTSVTLNADLNSTGGAHLHHRRALLRQPRCPACSCGWTAMTLTRTVYQIPQVTIS